MVLYPCAIVRVHPKPPFSKQQDIWEKEWNGILQCLVLRCEQVTQETLRLIEERDMLMLKLSTTMRELEGSRAASMVGSRTTTPVPGAGATLQPGIGLVFDPSAEIRGLHSK